MDKNKFFNENALSIAAIVVSLCAMFISFYQTNIMREQQYASVRPLVIVGNSMDINEKDRLFMTSLRNHKTIKITKRELEQVVPNELKKFIDL
jgi:hypothetical protein